MKTSKTDGVSRLQIPDEIVRKREFTAYDFALYAWLKDLKYRSSGKSVLTFRHRDAMTALGMKDTRTFKKALMKLKQAGVIMNKVLLPKHQPITVEVLFPNFTKVKANEKFTQLPSNLLRFIPQIGWRAFRLLYYYESYINRSIVGAQEPFCFVSFDTITGDLGLDRETLDALNDKVVSWKLLRVVKHQLAYDPAWRNGEPIGFKRPNNHYYVKVENMMVGSSADQRRIKVEEEQDRVSMLKHQPAPESLDQVEAEYRHWLFEQWMLVEQEIRENEGEAEENEADHPAVAGW